MKTVTYLQDSLDIKELRFPKLKYDQSEPKLSKCTIKMNNNLRVKKQKMYEIMTRNVDK